MRLICGASCALLLIVAAGCSGVLRGERAVDARLYPEPPRNAVTFWGHACAYVDVDGFGIVTDPVFQPGFAINRPRRIPAPPPEAYDQVDVVLVSHAHHDHLNPASLERLPASVVILCPRPVAKYLDDLERDVRPMRPGDVFPIPGGRIVAVPAHHPGGRISLKARSDGRALGFVIETSRITIYYSGDTEHFPGLERIGQDHRPDLALLNVNAHLHSADALLAVRALGAERVIPLHFGAYWSPKESRTARWRAELVGWLGSRVDVLAVGESRGFDEIRAKQAASGPQPSRGPRANDDEVRAPR